MSIKWEQHAARLAAEVTHPTSRWREPVARTPRHVFVRRWFTPTSSDFDRWGLHDGPSDEEKWLAAAYSDRSLVTSVAGLHADHAMVGQEATGRATSSSTLPTLVVIMLRCGYIQDGNSVLELGTGSGYSAALLTRRLGDAQVTSVDVDPYITEIARERLDSIGLHPKLITCDATGPLPGKYDRLVAMTSARPIPISWLQAVKTGGHLVATIADTALLITAQKTPDGGAVGQVGWIAASFMPARSTSDYPPSTPPPGLDAHEGAVSEGRYPIPRLVHTWDLRSMLQLSIPGTKHDSRTLCDGRRVMRLWHPDGSWAEASDTSDQQLPRVRQGGPRHLWDALDQIRHQWLIDCDFPLRGAKVRIAPDGTCELTQGQWQATLA